MLCSNLQSEVMTRYPQCLFHNHFTTSDCNHPVEQHSLSGVCRSDVQRMLSVFIAMRVEQLVHPQIGSGIFPQIGSLTSSTSRRKTSPPLSPLLRHRSMCTVWKYSMACVGGGHIRDAAAMPPSPRGRAAASLSDGECSGDDDEGMSLNGRCVQYALSVTVHS